MKSDMAYATNAAPTGEQQSYTDAIRALIGDCWQAASHTREALDRALGGDPQSPEQRPIAVPSGQLEQIQYDLRSLRDALNEICSRSNRIA